MNVAVRNLALGENRAAFEGPSKFQWWPDWCGQACAIVASGPSAKKAGVVALKGRIKVIAIKENIELCPFADVVYGCDAPFWRNTQGMPKFKGLKLSYARDLTMSYPDIKIVDIPDKIADFIRTDESGIIGSGGNSGFQALNLAVQFGATRILLIGFDMHDRSGVHWYGRANGPGRSNPCEYKFPRWRRAFAVAAGQLSGIDILNASAQSDLNCFKKTSVEQALTQWRL